MTMNKWKRNSAPITLKIFLIFECLLLLEKKIKVYSQINALTLLSFLPQPSRISN